MPGRKGVDNLHRGGKAARQSKTGAGRSKGRRGAKVLVVWKASRPFSHTHRFTRSSGMRSWRLSDMAPGARATLDLGGSRDHGCQKRVRTRRERKTTPPAMNTQPIRCGPPKRILPGVNQAIPRAKQAREPTRHGCSYEEVRRQKSVRRIARRSRTTSRKASRRRGAGPGALRTAC